jgi:RimJ/RimL family protein N-acetyltransferase
MERMPYRPELDSRVPAAHAALGPSPLPDAENWRRGLPTLHGSVVVLRELRVTDAPALFSAMSTEEVGQFISPAPHSIEAFQKFIGWAHRQRLNGQYVCFAVTVRGSDSAIGLFQLRSLDTDFGNSEWGFALAIEYWGTGIFTEGAQLAVDFAFDVLGVRRLEARAAVKNGRGNGALRKLGAMQEGVLRRSLLRNGEYLDQALWTIFPDEWLRAKAVWGPRIVH